jgi:hypothetical protein
VATEIAKEQLTMAMERAIKRLRSPHLGEPTQSQLIKITSEGTRKPLNESRVFFFVTFAKV